jgi:hypothetical protein
LWTVVERGKVSVNSLSWLKVRADPPGNWVCDFSDSLSSEGHAGRATTKKSFRSASSVELDSSLALWDDSRGVE